MTRKISAAGCIQRPSISSTTNHIWISDKLLTDTFHSFARRQQRHGSNVPGPLEARRRSAKRKNTNLAHVGASAPIDPAIFVDSTVQNGWWRRAGAPTSERSPPRWSWFLQPPEPPRPIPRQRDSPQFLLDLEYSLTKDDQIPISKQQIHAGLVNIQTVADLHTYLVACHIDLRRNPDICDTIVRHALEKSWPPRQLAELLEDPSFNPPGSSNHKLLVQHFQTQPMTKIKWFYYSNALKTATRLGMIGVTDLQEIILLVPNIKVSGSSSNYLSEKQIQRFDGALLSAIELSGVMEVEDLGRDFLASWFKKLESQKPTPHTLQLMWRLRSYSKTLEKDVTVKIVNGWINHCQQKESYDFRQLVTFLTRLPISKLVPSILHVTEMLVANAQSLQNKSFRQSSIDIIALKKVIKLTREQTAAVWNSTSPADSFSASFAEDDVHPEHLHMGSTGLPMRADTVLDGKPSALELWFSILTQLNHDTLPQAISEQQPWTTISHDEDTILPPCQRILSHCWTAIALSHGNPDAARLLNKLGMEMHVLNTFKEMQDPGTSDLLGRVVLVLSTMHLPAKQQLLRHLKFLTDGQMKPCGDMEHLSQTLEDLTKGGFDKLENRYFYDQVQGHYPESLKHLAGSVNKSLSEFQELSRALIMRSKKYGKIIQRILSHNQAIKLALGKAWASPSSSWLSLTEEPQVDPHLAVNLIHNLAISFATSPVISDRSAFRKVYWCYLYLHRYGGPMRPEMARALWHAGVTRQENNHSIELATFLLKIVRNIEGEEMAASLLQSTKFRQQRKEEILKLVAQSSGGRCKIKSTHDQM